MKEQRIISIYPNSIGFGYIVLGEKGEILDFGVSQIRPMLNGKCYERICEIIQYYQPTVLITEDYKKSGRRSLRVKKLIKKIYDFENNEIKIFKYTKDQIQNVYDVVKARNKYEMSRMIVMQYPELERKLPEKREIWKSENYWQGIFDAMVLLLTHYYLVD